MVGWREKPDRAVAALARQTHRSPGTRTTRNNIQCRHLLQLNNFPQSFAALLFVAASIDRGHFALDCGITLLLMPKTCNHILQNQLCSTQGPCGICTADFRDCIGSGGDHATMRRSQSQLACFKLVATFLSSLQVAQVCSVQLVNPLHFSVPSSYHVLRSAHGRILELDALSGSWTCTLLHAHHTCRAAQKLDRDVAGTLRQQRRRSAARRQPSCGSHAPAGGAGELIFFNGIISPYLELGACAPPDEATLPIQQGADGQAADLILPAGGSGGTIRRPRFRVSPPTPPRDGDVRFLDIGFRV